MGCFIKGMKAYFDTEKEEWYYILDTEPKQLELPLEEISQTKH